MMSRVLSVPLTQKMISDVPIMTNDKLTMSSSCEHQLCTNGSTVVRCVCCRKVGMYMLRGVSRSMMNNSMVNFQYIFVSMQKNRQIYSAAIEEYKNYVDTNLCRRA